LRIGADVVGEKFEFPGGPIGELVAIGRLITSKGHEATRQ